jgi:hypothetical protein
VAGVVLLTKLSSLLSPFNLYFTFSELISSTKNGYSPIAFLIKATIPILVGALYFTLSRHLSEQSTAMAGDARIDFELTAQVGAGFGALLLAWPALMLWEFVAAEAVLPLRVQFILVYALYVVSFAYLCSTGVALARLAWAQGLTSADLGARLRSQYAIISVGRPLIIALVTGGFADWASRHLISG